jgi:ABC-type phosphate/phosphonate transport system ATPase subunit
LKLIIGQSGTGKTKALTKMVNDAVETTNGSVVCIEKSNKLRYQVKYQCRLIEADDYMISDAQSLFGFVSGIIASNHDITDLFIDSALKICRGDLEAFDKFLLEIEQLEKKHGFRCVMTSTIDPSEATETMKRFI